MQPIKDEERMDNVCGISLQSLDFNLVEATLQSIETKTLTPIIKEELKLKIQSKRLAAGKEELPKTVFKEPEKFALTTEEEEKRTYRRERNRIAAAKCRNKRKYQNEHVKTTLAEEKLRNFTLKRKIEDLENEKEILLKKSKLPANSYPQATSPSTQPFLASSASPRIRTPSPSPSPSHDLTFNLSSPIPQLSSPIPESNRQFPPEPSPVEFLFSSPVQLSAQLAPVPLSPSPHQQLLTAQYILPPPPKYEESHNVSPVSVHAIAERTTSPAFPSHMQHETHFENMPSTSSGIYERVPRRYSDDTPRGLGIKEYQPRRYSADSYDQNDTTEYTHLLNNQADMFPQMSHVQSMPAFSKLLEEEPTQNEDKVHADNLVKTPNDIDIDLLSDEEFFRFENETLPFDSYRNTNKSDENEQFDLDKFVVSDGLKTTFPVTDTLQDLGDGDTEEPKKGEEELFVQEEAMDNCMLRLIPMFEDEAMVPEYNDKGSFHDPSAPTSPTFY